MSENTGLTSQNNSDYGTVQSSEPYQKLDENENTQNQEVTNNEEDVKENITSNNLSSKDNSNITVVVTGASGFIASHTIVKLLERGYNVVGTVRSKPDSAKYKWLRDLDKTGKQLRLVSANLLDEGAFDKCISNCDYCMHIASPYVLTVTDPQTQLVDPAVNGTINVLNSCLKSKSLKKVIITSSMAAITDEPVKRYTEADWNQRSSLTRQPYYYSKVLAEKAAWEFHNKHNPSWGLIAINPWVVIGPELHPNKNYNQSNGSVIEITNGNYPTRINLEFAYIDVRDVAEAHCLTMEKPEAKGRYILANKTWTMAKTCDYLDTLCETYNVKSKVPGCPCDCGWCFPCLWCMACFQPSGIKDFLRTHLNKTIQFDNSKIQNLGLEFHDVPTSLKDTFIWAKQAGIITSV